MAEQSRITQRASEYIFELFKEKLPEHLVYHNFAHTESVAAAARKLAKGMKLAEDAIEIVTLAGWFHDAGFIEAYHGHEDVSKRIAEEYLRGEGVSDQKIGFVLGCIEATRMPQSPKNLLEEILCDADMSALGKKTSFERSQLLRIEWEKALGKTMTDEEWLRQDLNFLTSHKYFTRYAQEIYDDRKLENIRERDKQLRKLIKVNKKDTPGMQVQEESVPVAIHEAHAETQGVVQVVTASDATANQIDRKAGILILANSLMIALTLGFVISSGRHKELIFPEMFLLGINVLTIIFAIIVVLPKKVSGDDIQDNYQVGQNIRRKNEFLRMSYYIFVVGLTLAVIFFFISSFQQYPEVQM